MASVIDSWGTAIWDCIERVGRYVGARHPDAYTAGFSTSLSPFYTLMARATIFQRRPLSLPFNFKGRSLATERTDVRIAPLSRTLAHIRLHLTCQRYIDIGRDTIFRYTVYKDTVRTILNPWYSLRFYRQWMVNCAFL